MATNIDKALYQQPAGIDALAQDEEAIEIEIVDPEEVNIAIGDLEISIGEGDDDTFSDNLADEVTEGALQSMASELCSDIDNDKASRKDWILNHTKMVNPAKMTPRSRNPTQIKPTHSK